MFDTGSSTHMTEDEKLPSDCKPMKAVTVTVINGDRLTAASIGSVTFLVCKELLPLQEYYTLLGYTRSSSQFQS